MDLETEGSLGDRVEFISFDILSLSFVDNERPQISPSIYGALREIFSTPISLRTLLKFQVSSLLG